MNMATEYETVNIKPSRRAPLRFDGKLIAECEWEFVSGWMRFQIWQTVGGALIAVREGGPDDDTTEYTDALVVEPVALAPDDDEGQPPFVMRDAVMTFFDFHDRARSMVRKGLKWSLLRIVP